MFATFVQRTNAGDTGRGFATSIRLEQTGFSSRGNHRMGPPFDSVQLPYKWLNYGLW